MQRILPAVTARIKGRPAPVDSIRVMSDSPVDFHLPPQVGGIAGAEADIDLAAAHDTVTAKAMPPWSPASPARPGSPVTVDIDGHRAFTGIVDAMPHAMSDGSLSVSCVDPLADTHARFSARAWLPLMPAEFGGGGALRGYRTGCSLLSYVERALSAVGVHSTVPEHGRTDLHVPMQGSLMPSRGDVWRAPEYAAPTPWVPIGGGRLGMASPNVVFRSRTPAPDAPTVGTWLLVHEVATTGTAGRDYILRTLGAASTAGFAVRVANNVAQMRVYSDDSGGSVYVVGGGLDLTDDVERIMVRYNTITGRMDLRGVRSDGTITATVVGPAPFLIDGHTTTARQLRVHLYGDGPAGAVSLSSRTGDLPTDQAGMLAWVATPRRLSIDMTASQVARYALRGHPPVVDEPAVQWLVSRAAQQQGVLWSGTDGTVHIADPTGWASLPVSHTITDARINGAVDLDDVTFTMQRRRPYSQVRVLMERAVPSLAAPTVSAGNRLYATTDQEVTLRAGDDPVELLYHPHREREGQWWVTPADLDIRYAGEPVQLRPGGHVADFARGHGSWGGGHVRKIEQDANGDDVLVRHALSTEWGQIIPNPRPADVLYDAVQVDARTIRVRISPGPGLGPDEEYVNLPHPDSPGLRAQNPRRFTEYLPRIRGWAVASTTPVSSDSDPLPVDEWATAQVYEHDGGMAPVATSAPDRLAQQMADRHRDHFGQVIVDCDLDPTVNPGQRVHIKPTSRADVTLDGIVTGVPSMEVTPGSASMRLRVWVTSVTAHSVTYAERAALTQPGTTYSDDQAAHYPATYSQERDRAIEAGVQA